MRPYVVIVGDCAGERARHEFATFAEANAYAQFVHAHATWQACQATAQHLTRMFCADELEALRRAAEGM